MCQHKPDLSSRGWRAGVTQRALTASLTHRRAVRRTSAPPQSAFRWLGAPASDGVGEVVELSFAWSPLRSSAPTASQHQLPLPSGPFLLGIVDALPDPSHDRAAAAHTTAMTAQVQIKDTTLTTPPEQPQRLPPT